MLFLNMIFHYFIWHYSRAFVDLFRVWSNFLWFTHRFFSMSSLVRTLFSPWRKITEEGRGGAESFFSALVINTMMRFVGFFMRILLLLVGWLSLLVVFFAGVLAVVVWIFAPLIIVTAFIIGIMYLFE